MSKIIVTEGLTKRYGKKTVLNDVSISLSEGEIYGIVGNNGAGKSTLLKIICGLVKQSSGSVTFSKKGIRIGSLIERPGLYGDMTAFQNIKAKALCMGVKYKRKQIEDLISLVGLEDVQKKNVVAYSMGMRQRLGLALALVGEPDVLVLDEPINGLDPQGIAEIRQVIMEVHKERNIAILVSSHILDELVKIATSFCVIDRGRVIKQSTKEEFMSECGDREIDEYYIDIIKQSRESSDNDSTGAKI